MTDLNIHQRLNACMKEVSYIQKDTTVSGYRAMSHDGVIAMLRPAMVKHGVGMVVQQTNGKVIQNRDPAANIKMLLYSGTYDISFVNIDTPTDFITTRIQAHASDNGDKAPGKCASYAIKTVLLKTFYIETGENDESRTYEAPQFTELQQAEFNELLESDNALGFVCFSRTVGEDVMNALSGGLPKGQISSGKAKMRSLGNEGWSILKGSAAAIKEAIAESDQGKLLETVAELEPVERKLVAGMLEPSEIKAIKDVQSLAAQ